MVFFWSDPEVYYFNPKTSVSNGSGNLTGRSPILPSLPVRDCCAASRPIAFLDSWTRTQNFLHRDHHRRFMVSAPVKIPCNPYMHPRRVAFIRYARKTSSNRRRTRQARRATEHVFSSVALVVSLFIYILTCIDILSVLAFICIVAIVSSTAHLATSEPGMTADYTAPHVESNGPFPRFIFLLGPVT